MQIGDLRLQGLRVKRQRVEMCLHAFAQVLRRLPAVRFSLRGETEFLQNLRIDVDIDGFGITCQHMAFGPFQVTLVPVTHVLVGLG